MRAEQTYYVGEQDWSELKKGVPWILMVGQAMTHVVFEGLNGVHTDSMASIRRTRYEPKAKPAKLKITKGSGNGRNRTPAFKRKVVAFAHANSISETERRYHVAGATVKKWMKDYPAKGDA
jgi:hypothetical protein